MPGPAEYWEDDQVRPHLPEEAFDVLIQLVEPCAEVIAAAGHQYAGLPDAEPPVGLQQRGIAGA